MYAESTGSRKTLGDVDVIYHDGLYHLFHLVLPNHDFIAHAVSEDGFTWHRVSNALFIGNPGSWDDSMLWTMHVTPDPHHQGHWRMFYTGLSRRDRGLKQRLGMATSSDLYRWTKAPVSWQDHRRQLAQLVPDNAFAKENYDSESCFPLEPNPVHYEASLDEGRHWVSWRDPFYYREGERGWLLCAGRVNQGPIVRRGCVAVMEETAPNQFQSRPALYHPGLYDDIEVPNLIQIEGEYYLIGSLREDAKIRYWHTDAIGQPWRSYHDNVLLARGNYAGRICQDAEGVLIWNFYTPDTGQRTVFNLMPPPKRLVRTSNGMLRVHSFEGFERRVERKGNVSRARPLRCSLSAEQCDALVRYQDDALHLRSESGFEAFVFPDQVRCFRFSVYLDLCGLGKCGLVFRLDEETHDGYYLSLDLNKGVAQMRAWGTGPDAGGEDMMQFRPLQAAFWDGHTPGSAQLTLLAFGSYLELSVNGRVILSLADQTYSHGLLGVYVESATMDVRRAQLEHLRSPSQSDEHLPEG